MGRDNRAIMEKNLKLEESLSENIQHAAYPVRPTPTPIPIPEFYCLRFGPVSGRYAGEMSTPNSGAYYMDLRVDIDPCQSNAVVLKKVSGDTYRVFRWGSFKWYQYLNSWIIDAPTVNWSRCSVGIKGNVRYWQGAYLMTTAEIVIPWLGYKVGPAKVTFKTLPWLTSTYVCSKKSRYFRDVKLEIDVCQSQNSPPIHPTYHTHAHSNRPTNLPPRNLTVEAAYKEAGINMTLDPSHSIINDAGNPTWTDSELHDAMETHFSKYSGSYKTWNYWVLLASSYVNSSVAGIMFDYSVEPPDRQGSAVFKSHNWFNNLPAGVPANDLQTEALRYLIYCYVHEIGHGFNLMHSWQKQYANPPQTNRPYSLSWMNYAWKYDQLPGKDPGDFWGNFMFRFDAEELIHIRHGDRNAVIFGGEPFTKGAALGRFSDTIGDLPIELTIRGKNQFDYLEPVIAEIKVKNLTDTTLPIAKELNPEFGATKILIEKPDGTTVEFHPIMCKLAKTDVIETPPEKSHYENVMVSFGKHGHYFKDPGKYRLQAIYQGLGDVLVTSKIHEIVVKPPLTPEEEEAGSRYYTRDVGIALYLKGSDSTFLEPAMGTLDELRSQFIDRPLGAHLSVFLADNLSKPFHRIEDGKRVLARQQEPQKAIDLIDEAMRQHVDNENKTLHNITYHEAVKTKMDMLRALKKDKDADNEISALVTYLEDRNVKKHILNMIEGYKKTK